MIKSSKTFWTLLAYVLHASSSEHSKRQKTLSDYDEHKSDFLVTVVGERRAGIISLLCSGVLLDPTHVLTSSMCINRASGTSHQSQWVKRNRISTSAHEDVTYHPIVELITSESDADDFADNVAILEVQPPFTMQTTLRIKPRWSSAPTERCTVTGRSIIFKGEQPGLNKLRVVEASPVEQKQCFADLRKMGFSHSEGVMCVSIHNSKQICAIDSGSPLVCGENLVGIASFGQPCVEEAIPFLFINVSVYGDWIRHHVTDKTSFSEEYETEASQYYV